MKPTKPTVLVLGTGDCRPIDALIKTLLMQKYHVVNGINDRQRRKFNASAFPDAPPILNIHSADREHGWYLQFNKAKKNKHFKHK